MPEVGKILLDGESSALIPAEDKAAAGAITPGDLVESDGSGGLQVHGTADGNAPLVIVALEPMGVALTNERTIDKAYAAADTVRHAFPRAGAKLYMWLAAGQNVAEGATLVSNGAGKLQAPGAGTDPLKIVAVAAEAVNNGAGTVPVRIRVRRRS